MRVLPAYLADFSTEKLATEAQRLVDLLVEAEVGAGNNLVQGPDPPTLLQQGILILAYALLMLDCHGHYLFLMYIIIFSEHGRHQSLPGPIFIGRTKSGLSGVQYVRLHAAGQVATSDARRRKILTQITINTPIHDDEHACRLCPQCGGVVDDPVLQPDGRDLQTDTGIHNRVDILRGPEDIHQVDVPGYGIQIRIGWLTQHTVHGGTHRHDGVAILLQGRRYSMGWPVGPGREPDYGNPLAAL